MSIIKNYEYFLSVLVIFLFSIFINNFYGNIGVFPLDSFLSFDAGYKFSNGELPFRDIWSPFGFTLDLIQGFIFHFFGISWNNYVVHASVFNSLLALATFHILNKFNIKIIHALIFSILISVVSYPVPATPFLDHHSVILSILMLYSFILHLKTKKNFYLIFIPIFFSLAFLSKQTPSAYILVCLSFVGLIYLIFNFSYKKIISLLIGIFIVVFFLSFFFFINKIPFSAFWQQYILFPLTIADTRIGIDFLYPLEFNRIFTRFKIIHLSLIPILISIFLDLRAKEKFYLKEDFYIKLSIILFSYSLIFHQLMTLNQKFIFMIIPLNLAFAYIYSKNFKFKYFNLFLITVGLVTIIYNKISYLDNRKFMELENVNLKNAKKAADLHYKFNKLKWITPGFKDNSSYEINMLGRILDKLREENDKVLILTHYQFFSAILQKKNFFTFSKTYTYDSISLPKKNDKYFLQYKSFVINKIKKNKINKIYIVGKDINLMIIIDLFGQSCLKVMKNQDLLKIYDISNCLNKL